MANSAWYPNGVLNLMNTTIDLDVNTLKLVGVTSAYTFSTAHNDYADLTNVVAGTETAALTSITTTQRTFDFANPTLVDPGTGGPVDAFVLFKDTGVAGNDLLIAYIGSTDTTGLPLTLDGTNDTLTLNNSGDGNNGLLVLGGADSNFTGSYGMYASWAQYILDTPAEDITANTDRFFVVGIDDTAYTPSRGDGGHTTLADVTGEVEVTDHIQVDSGAAGDISFSTPYVRFDAPNTTLPNDGSGTLKSLLLYYLPTGQSWSATGPVTPANARLVAHIDVNPDVTMDGTSDTLSWAATGIWGFTDSTNW